MQALDPKREAGWLNLGLLAQRRQDTPSALRAYMAALKANPSSGSAYIGLGGVMESGVKPDAANAAYEKAIELDGSNEAAHSALCKLLLRLDRPDASRQAAQRAVDAMPQVHVFLCVYVCMRARARACVRADEFVNE